MAKIDKKAQQPYSFSYCFVQSSEVGRAVAFVDEIVDQGGVGCQLKKWTKKDDQWSFFSLDYPAVRICILERPEFLFFDAGPYGQVGVADDDGDYVEEVDSSLDSPWLRDMRYIGSHLYVCGMRRMMYRREGKNKWAACDQGVRQSLDSVIVEKTLNGKKETEYNVTGFNSMDGLDEGDIYAVGYAGEMWRCQKGKWSQIMSPTNLVLNKVRVVNKKLVYVCGQKGILLRGYGDTWDLIRHDVTESDFWGMEWYRESLYLATAGTLYRLTPDDDLEEVDVGIKKKSITFGHLHANDGVMMSAGAKHILWTEDGIKWRDITP